MCTLTVGLPSKLKHQIDATPHRDTNMENVNRTHLNALNLSPAVSVLTSHPALHTDLTESILHSKRFSDIILATILATKSDMCGKKFELKIDNVRFVGHPTLLQHPPIIQVWKKIV